MIALEFFIEEESPHANYILPSYGVKKQFRGHLFESQYR